MRESNLLERLELTASHKTGMGHYPSLRSPLSSLFPPPSYPLLLLPHPFPTSPCSHLAGPVHDQQREHLRQIHLLRLEHQARRHVVEKEQLDANHEQALVKLQKKQWTTSKAYKNELKKLSITNEEVLAVYRRQTNPAMEHLMGTADRKLAKKLAQMEKEAMEEAKQQHVAESTIRLSQQQMKELEELRTQQEDESEQLHEFFKQQQEFMKQAMEAEMKALEDRIDTEINGIKKVRMVGWGDSEETGGREGRNETRKRKWKRE